MVDYVGREKLTADDLFQDKEVGVREVVRKISQEEFRKRMCTLTAFNKQMEKGRMEARSIACCSIPFKVLNWFLETLWDLWLERVSALKLTSLGKSHKLRALALKHGDASVSTTGDNSKWNEAISMTETAFNTLGLMKLILKSGGVISQDDYNGLRTMLSVYKWMYENKRVKLGSGIAMGTKNGTIRETNLNVVLQKSSDERLKALIAQVLDKWDEKENTVLLETGMFMGMANKASTGNAYMHTMSEGKIQSSDDFCVIEVGTVRHTGKSKKFKTG